MNQLSEDQISIKLANDRDEYWTWCCSNVNTKTWRKKIPLMGNSATYIFDNPADATAFKLVFNV